MIILSFLSFQSFAQDTKKVVYLISVSSAYNENAIPKIIKVLQNKGYAVDTRYLNQQVSDFGYVNTAKEVSKNLIKALTDNEVKYLWFVRGGSGGLNLFPYIYNNLEKIKNSKEKLIIGFSDVTAIHYFLNNYIGWKSIHGILANYNKDMYKDDTQVRLSMNNGFDQVSDVIKNGLSYDGLIPLNVQAKSGVSGFLGGGNLTLLQSFFSTKYEKYSSNQILLMEDTGVTYKQLDRNLHQLLYKEDFKPKAIIFGQFYTLTATDEERLIFKTVIKEFAEKTKIPVYYYPYFGHGITNNPFIFNQMANIKCQQGEEYCKLIQKNL